MDQTQNEQKTDLKEFGRIVGWCGAILIASHLIVSIVEAKTERA